MPEVNSVYGYLRVSTDKQNIDNAKKNILMTANTLKLSNVTWIEEVVTGTKHWKERELGNLLEKANKGDTIIMQELSRIGRTTFQILEFISECAKKEVNVHIVQGNIKMDNSVSCQAIIFANSITSQIERELISERTKTALATKKANGVILGRPKGVTKLDAHKDEIRQQLENGVKMVFLEKKYKVSRGTMHTFVKANNLKPS